MHLVVVTPTSVQPVALAGQMTIGASAEATVRIADAELAPIHCRIEERPEGFVLVREASPLLVNGQRLRVHVLVPDDLVVLGKVALSVRAGDAPRSSTPQVVLSRLAALRSAVERGEDSARIAATLVEDVVLLARATQGALVRFANADDPVRIASASTPGFSPREAEFSRTLLARMLREESAVFVPSTLDDGELAGAQSLVGTGPLSALAVPVFADGRIVGALYVSAPSVPGLSPEATELASAYTTEAAALIDAQQVRARLADRLEALGEDGDDDGRLLGRSAPMVGLRRLVRKVAANGAPILVRGETGTGKEVVAREVHRLSARAAGPFVALNCGAIPEGLLGSELFGHVKGAFTGASHDRLGAFRSAQGGTLFLDEIGDMPLSQQVALLRAVQEHEVTPVGSERPIAVDVRLVLATHRDLEAEVAAGRFRQDLYYRIAILSVEVPPLRARGGDVLMLAEHFLRQRAPGRALRLSDAAARILSEAPFPGNVRELEALMARAALLTEGDEIASAGLEGHVSGARSLAPSARPAAPAAPLVRPLSLVRDEYLRAYVKKVVEHFGGNRTEAADALMVSVRTVFKYLEE